MYTFEDNGTHEAKVLVETVDGTTLADQVEIPVEEDEESSSKQKQSVPGPGAAVAAVALGGLACAARD